MYINNYVFVLNEDGTRETSLGPDNYHFPIGKEKMLEQAREQYPDKECIWVEDGDDMMSAFMDGKIYKSGQMVDAPVVGPSAAEIRKANIEAIKAKYETLKKELMDKLLVASLANNTTAMEQIRAEYAAIPANMAKELKGA